MSTYDYAYQVRWRMDRLSGVDRSPIPVERVREHIEALVAAGATPRGIATAAGIGSTTLYGVLNGRSKTMHRRVALRVLAVGPDDVLGRDDDEGLVPAHGAERRIRALLALGWTHAHITEAMDGRHSNLVLSKPSGAGRRMGPGRWVTKATHDAVVQAYDALSMSPGPSSLGRQRAARLGYPPPLAWDNIDDPDATPDLGERKRGADLDEFMFLVRAGEDPVRAAQRCGVTIGGIEQAARRTGRDDVVAAVTAVAWAVRRKAVA